MSGQKPFHKHHFARPHFARPLSELLEPCLGPALAAHGFTSSHLLTAWPDIVGPHLSAYCEPLKLEWRSRGPRSGENEPATLVIRVESAFALEVQHQAPVLINRINAHYGWRCVSRIVTKQGPVRHKQRSKLESRPACNEQDQVRIKQALNGIDQQNLQDALLKLGQEVMRQK